MKIYLMPRGSGKTMYLIRRSAKSGSTIVCHSQQVVKSLMLNAASLGLEIPRPITYDDLVSERCQDWELKGLLIDDVHTLLQKLAGPTPVVAVTMTEEEQYG